MNLDGMWCVMEEELFPTNKNMCTIYAGTGYLSHHVRLLLQDQRSWNKTNHTKTIQIIWSKWLLLYTPDMGSIQFWNWNWWLIPIPELELTTNFKKMELEFNFFLIGIEVCHKNLYLKFYLPFNFSIQKYFFHDNPSWNIPSRYLE